ncbi:Ca2+-binding RTX toxin-like protein [Bradyrhizobium sp. LB7.2]
MAINLTGNEFGQAIIGNVGANTLDGKGGADTMQGLGGNDFYVVDNAGDKVLEAVGGGVDRVASSVSYTLAAGQEIERLDTTSTAGTTAINLTGNEFGASHHRQRRRQHARRQGRCRHHAGVGRQRLLRCRQRGRQGIGGGRRWR